jgi:two-component system LytT family response regulator
MGKLSCIIIDDEPSAHKVLINYCANTDSIDLKQQFFNARDAIAYLSANKVEIILLDINMPEINGFDFIKKLDYKPAIVLTTAYGTHALKSYEYDVADFLVKPIRFKRFEEAILKVRTLYEKNIYSYQRKQFIEIKDKGNLVNIKIDHIIYIQSIGNYVKIFTKKKNYMLHTTTNELEKNLDPACFIRIHKSYIINKAFLKKTEHMQVQLGDQNTELPIGKTYIKFLSEKLNNLNHR